MGEHSGALKVYGAPRLRLLATLARISDSPQSWLATVLAVILTAMLIQALPVAALSVAVVLVMFWSGAFVAWLTAPTVLISDRHRWDQVDTSCKLIIRYLPGITLLSRQEVRAETEVARWDLACLLRDRTRLSNLLNDAERATRSLADDDPLRDELALRRSTLATQLATMDAEIEPRTARLRNLAAQCRSFAEDEMKVERARSAAERALRALDQADKGIAEAATWDNRPDPAANFTERASTVVAAYRELTRNSGQPTLP